MNLFAFVVSVQRVVVNTGVSDYANLEDIRKSSIHPQKARQSVATNGKTPVGVSMFVQLTLPQVIPKSG